MVNWASCTCFFIFIRKFYAYNGAAADLINDLTDGTDELTAAVIDSTDLMEETLSTAATLYYFDTSAILRIAVETLDKTVGALLPEFVDGL
ncbi:hypothetical protein P879_08080 [Paragonimus westermani]|uniref:Uncharacterized protein n=1 Tax=Paragonimus westermani TaxID=34504 RepID=A0A8T0D484_9TREM|nr:hypothetical protein P879_08080 [Paragonimus westermani]